MSRKSTASALTVRDSASVSRPSVGASVDQRRPAKGLVHDRVTHPVGFAGARGRRMGRCSIGLALTIAASGIGAWADGVEFRQAVTREPSLIGYYPFDADLPPIVTDVHTWGQPAQGHNGRLTGEASLVSDAKVGCQSLRPGTGRVDLGNVPAYEFADGTGTIEAFLYQREATPGYNPCFLSCRQDSQHTRYSLHGDSEGMALYFWNGTDAAKFDFPASTNSMIGRWAHVAFVFNGGLVTAFLDGANLGTKPGGFGEFSGLPMQIGASGPGNEESWPGQIDELAIYDDPVNSVDFHWWWELEFAEWPFDRRPENTEPAYACGLAGATNASSASNVASGQALWTWQAPADGWTLVTARGTECVAMNLRVERLDPLDTFQPPIAVWTNSGSAHYGNGGASSDRSAVLFWARPGDSFRFRLDPGPYAFPSSYRGTFCGFGFSADRLRSYDAQIDLEQISPPANDSATIAARVDGEFPAVSGSNWGATAEPGDPGGVEGLSGATVWWRWRAPTSREVTVSTRGSEIHTFLAVYELDTAGERTLLVVNAMDPELERAADIGPFTIAQTSEPPSLPFPASDILPRTSRVTFAARQDREYLIAVDGFRYADGAEGMGKIRLNWEGVTLESYQESATTRLEDDSLVVSGTVRLVNRGIADSGPLRLRVVGTRIFPGTARGRDPGRQESPASGTNLVTEPFVQADPLSTASATEVAVAFTIPPPSDGVFPKIGDSDFCSVDLAPFRDFELANLIEIAYPLKGMVEPRSVDTWLAEQLSPEAKAALADYQGEGSDEAPLRTALVRDVNRLALGPSIYDEARFAGITLSAETKELLAHHPQTGTALSWLNQLLIGDAYPGAWMEWTKWRYLPRCLQWATSTGSAYAWRAGAILEVQTDTQQWLPVAYYPLRHGPWPNNGSVTLMDGSGPTGGVGHTGNGGYGQWHGALKLRAPAQLVSGTSSELEGTYEVYLDDQLDDSSATGDKLRIEVVDGPGRILEPRTVVGLPTPSETNLTIRGTYQPGNGKAVEAEVVIRVVPAAKQDQAITFARLYPARYGDGDIALAATASSGLTVRFRIVSGPGEVIDNAFLRLTGAGEVVVRAEQDGNEMWNPSPPVEQNLSVAKGQQTITFSEIGNVLLGHPPIVLEGVATSGLKVEFELVSGAAKLSGNLLTPTGAGEITIRAVQTGDENWDPATTVDRRFEVFERDAARPVILGYGIASGEAGPQLELRVQAPEGLMVRLEARGDLNPGAGWQPVGDWRRSDGGSRLISVPIVAGFEFFRVVADAAGG